MNDLTDLTTALTQQPKSPTYQAYSELQQAHAHYNKLLFNGELRECIMTLQRSKSTIGYFAGDRWFDQLERTCDEIALNPEYFATCPLIEILQVLVHNMVHQWQHQQGSASRNGYHNRLWAEKMESIGLIPTDTGKPGGKKIGQTLGEYPAKGGLFEHATVQLLTAGFALSWKDRFAAPRDTIAVAFMPDLELDDSSPAQDSDSLGPLSAPPLATHNPLPVLAELAAFEPDNAPPTLPLLPEQFEGETPTDDPTNYRAALTAACVAPEVPSDIVRAKKRSGGQRTRYECPKCRTHVWGKAGLNIICGDCKNPFGISQNCQAEQDRGDTTD